MIGWSLVVGRRSALVLLALARRAAARVHRATRAVLAQAHALWPLFALMQPIGAVVFALDGILIGAGDTR